MLEAKQFQENIQLSIHISMGVAYYPQHGISYDLLYKAAGKALYDAKRYGKNRISIYCN